MTSALDSLYGPSGQFCWPLWKYGLFSIVLLDTGDVLLGHGLYYERAQDFVRDCWPVYLSILNQKRGKDTLEESQVLSEWEGMFEETYNWDCKDSLLLGVYASLSHQWEESQYKVKHQGRLHYTTWSRLLPILLNERFGPPLVALLERNGFVALDWEGIQEGFCERCIQPDSPLPLCLRICMGKIAKQ